MEEKIKAILGEIVENPERVKEINGKTNIISDIGLDSLKMINFILKVEEELEIYIDLDKFNYDYLTSIEKFIIFLSHCEKIKSNNIYK